MLIRIKPATRKGHGFITQKLPPNDASARLSGRKQPRLIAIIPLDKIVASFFINLNLFCKNYDSAGTIATLMPIAFFIKIILILYS